MIFLFLLLSTECFAGAKAPPKIEPPIDKSGPLRFEMKSVMPNDPSVDIVSKADALIRKTIFGKCFENKLLARNDMIQTEGRTPKQVLEHVRSFSGQIRVVMYYRCMSFNLFKCPFPTSAVAFNEPPSRIINLNRAYFTTVTPPSRWGSTMLHEASHAIGGYTHDFEPTARRPHSVPYVLNDVFEDCARYE